MRFIQGNQEISMKCYLESIKLKRGCTLGMKAMKVDSRISPPGGTDKGDEAHHPSSEEIKD